MTSSFTIRLLLATWLTSVSALGANSVATFGSMTLVPTINSCSVYASYTGDDNTNSVCAIRYRVNGQSEWKNGHPCWTDPYNSRYAGSIVYLAANTTYNVAIDLTDADGTPATTSITNNVTTWADTPTIGSTVDWSSSSNTTVTISSGGASAGSFKRYGVADGAARPVIGVNTNYGTIITVNADNVLIQNVDFIGGTNNSILVKSSKTNVWIRNCTFKQFGWPVNPSMWGSPTRYYESIPDDALNTGIRVGESAWDASHNMRIVIENCTFGPPMGGANSWWNDSQNGSSGQDHPSGPSAIFFCMSDGQHVIRYNKVTGTTGHWYNDGISGSQNESTEGAWSKDSDLYGNIISECWDDGIESDGGNQNVRIWGNVITNAHVAISTGICGVGPCWIFRNLYFYQRTSGLDLTRHDECFHKAGHPSGIQRRVYDYFNTIDNPQRPGQAIGQGAGAIRWQISSNNIWQTEGSVAYDQTCQFSFYDHDLCKVGFQMNNCSGQEANAITGSPSYVSNASLSNILGDWFLSSGSAGYRAGTPINNFGQAADGSALSNPNVGAFDERFPVLAFGPQAAGGGGGATTNFYCAVNGSSGNTGLTEGSPWTLTYALANAGPSNVINALDGTYLGTFQMGAAGQTLKAKNKWAAILVTDTNTPLSIYPAANSNCVIDGLQITGANTNSGIYVRGNNSLIQNCWVHHNGTNSAGYHYGIEGHELIGTIVQQCLVEFNGYGANDHGIYLAGTNTVIRGNVMRHNAGGGAQVYFYNTDYPNAITTNTWIYNNLSYSNGQYALLIGSIGAPNYYVMNNTLIQGAGNACVYLNDSSGGGQDAVMCATNNLFIGASVITGNDVNWTGDHNYTNAAIGNAGFVDVSKGLYWLESGSGARGVAATGIIPPFDFFGNAQASVADAGAFQYSAAYAADTRTLDPSAATGANYWAGLTATNSPVRAKPGTKIRRGVHLR